MSASFGEQYALNKRWNCPESRFGNLPPSTQSQYRQAFGHILGSFDYSPQIAEIGFGNGSFLTFCQGYSSKIDAVEVIPSLVDLATRAGFNSCDYSSFCKNELTYDIIGMFSVLEHFTSQQSLDFFELIQSKLKPGGYLFLIFPNGDSPFSLPFQNGDFTHVSHIGKSMLEQFINSTPLLEIVTVRSLPMPSVGFKGYLRSTLIKSSQSIISFLLAHIFYSGVKIDLSMELYAIIRRTS